MCRHRGHDCGLPDQEREKGGPITRVKGISWRPMETPTNGKPLRVGAQIAWAKKPPDGWAGMKMGINHCNSGCLMLYCIHNRTHGYSQVLFPAWWREKRIGNGVKVSDRTAAVRSSRGRQPLILRLRRGHGDEAESEDLPVKSAYWVLRTKEQYVPWRDRTAAHAAVFPDAPDCETEGRTVISRRCLSALRRFLHEDRAAAVACAGHVGR